MQTATYCTPDRLCAAHEAGAPAGPCGIPPIDADKTEAARMQRIRSESDLATVCLTMVSIHVKMPGVESFVVRAMPWEFLDTCKNLRDAGAENMFAYPGRGLESWQWFRPMRATKVRRTRAAA